MFSEKLRPGFWVLLTLVVVVLAFTGCGKKTTQLDTGKKSGATYGENGLPRDEKVELLMLMPSQGYGKDYFMYTVKTFEEKFPNVKINVRWVEGRPAYRNLIQSLLQSGNDDDMYDYFYGFEGWTEQLIEQGKIEPQDDLWNRNFYDNASLKVKDALIVDERLVFKNGHIFALPEGMNVMGLFYNKKMFRQYGWNESPETWDEFLTLCAQIKNTGLNPMVISGQKPGYFSYTWGAIPFEIGGQRFADALYNWDPDVYSSIPYLKMLERLKVFAKKDYFHPGTISFDHTQSQMEFLQGKAAMVSTGCWIEKEMENVMPTNFEWGFMPFPGNDEGQKQVVLTNETSPGYIWKNRPELNKKWLKEFKLWCLNLDIQREFMITGIIPVRKDFELNIENKKISQSVAIVLDAIRNQKVVVQSNRYDYRVRQINNPEMAKLNKTITDGYVKIITDKATPKEVSREIDKQYKRGLEADK